MSLAGWSGPAHALAKRVRAWVRGSLIGAPPESFAALALDLHRHQHAHCPVISRLIADPAAVWTDIPAVPVELFKRLEVGTVSANDASVCFRTSGTTGGGRGAHRMRSTALYDEGALAWVRQCVPDAPGRVVSLLHDPQLAPDSSLSHMVGLFTAFGSYGGTASWHLVQGRLDRTGLDTALRQASGPLFVAATAFALAEWLGAEVPTLPPHSVLMVTGGFKGRHHRLQDEALYAAARERLLPERLVTEYGMTELSSQLWGTPTTAYRPPPWLRVVAVDPETGAPRPTEHEGQLRFYDLCNLDGSVAIDTLDAGVVHTNGTVTLRGRLSGSPARGCSLTVEEAWDRGEQP